MYSIKLKLSTRLGEDKVYALGEALNGLASSHSAMKNDKPEYWQLEWLMDKEPDTNDMTERMMSQAEMISLDGQIDITPQHWDVEELDDKNWLEECYKTFNPFSVGPFFIYGAHHDGGVPAQQIGMQIDAATAFGSGEHGTTKGCLQAMLDIKGQGVCPWNILDMGTGSGILAIAAWKLWQSPVLGVDIQAESVRVATHHATLNDVPLEGEQSKDGKVQFIEGDNAKIDAIKARAPYELIMANILSEPLKELAPGFGEIADSGGYIILSGMLEDQAASIRNRYEQQGFSFQNKIVLDGWTTLVMRKLG